MPALVFDLGGTHLRCGVASPEGIREFDKQRIPTFLDGLSPCEISSQIAIRITGYINGSSERAGNAAIILAFPGPILKRRRAISAPTLYGAATGDLPDIAGDLTERTGRPVHILNDVSAAAWGLSANTAATRFMVVTISSGIGAKLFDREHPLGVIDDPPFAGEIGHHVVDTSPNAVRCDCGGSGHLGGIASGRGIERLARRLRGDDQLTNERDIVPAIRAGEPWAVDVLEQATKPLARTLLAVTLASGLEKVFIVGGFAQAIGHYYAEVLNGLMLAGSQYQILEPLAGQMVEMPGLDEEQCLKGAACYAALLGVFQ
jgi:C7-cyclitol 7-kinase